RSASGFIYYVSVAGVTGARAGAAASVEDSVKKVRRFTKLPVSVGFGISTPEQARRVSRSADGVVVGSAVVNVIQAATDVKKAPQKVGRFVGRIKAAMKRP
ncbi:MAG: geranylgeranylglyceryl/heptaprenylglyceryl phosphate synthase, partial [Thermodesulfobacteriota bacterium]